MPANLEIELVCSPIGCPPDQHATVRGLGLRKLHSKRILADTPEVRGMIHKISHLVAIVGTGAEMHKKTKKAAPKKHAKKIAKE